jgi:hypothetical protein
MVFPSARWALNNLADQQKYNAAFRDVTFLLRLAPAGGGVQFGFRVRSRHKKSAVILRSVFGDEESHPCRSAGAEATKQHSTRRPSGIVLDEILRCAQNDGSEM